MAVVEGPKLFREAVAAGTHISEAFVLVDDGDSLAVCAEHDIPATTVSAEALARIATTDTPQSPVAVFRIPGLLTVDRNIVVGWGVGDPGNVGTLIRTAVGFGLTYAAGPESADPWSPKTIRAAAGAHLRSGVGMVPDLSVLAGHQVVATDISGTPIAELSVAADRPIAILVGDEANGLPGAVLDAADSVVSIPMPGGTESLNAAVAGAIAIYELKGRSAGQ